MEFPFLLEPLFSSISSVSSVSLDAHAIYFASLSPQFPLASPLQAKDLKALHSSMKGQLHAYSHGDRRVGVHLVEWIGVLDQVRGG